MSKVKPIVIVTDGNGRVTMTVDEMKKLLDDAFELGRESGTTTINNHYPYYRGWWNDPYYTTTCGTATTLTSNATEVTTNLTIEGKED